MNRFPRTAGVLLHITSLPGGQGIGDLGSSAYAFVDFLQAAGQHWWQILPLGPPAEGNSPYSAYSAFAGNPLLISLEALQKKGWLRADDLPDIFDQDSNRVDYAAVAQAKSNCLRQAFGRFQQQAFPEDRAAYDEFCEKNSSWLTDFAFFAAILSHCGQSDWSQWPISLVKRHESDLADLARNWADDMHFARFVQFLFDQQWTALKSYANQRDVHIYGDMPIFVAYESADVWANQSQFQLDSAGRRETVAGVPPDYFSQTGQLWGNPLYRWDVMAADNYAWWVQRFAAALRQFDLFRVDHFRGFESYWEIPATAQTAVEGHWQPGPGAAPFDAARAVLGQLPIVAEDLGLITDAVHHLRDQLRFPGMRVFQFGFADLADDYHRPTSYPEHSVAYTGTHDNDTLMGWYSQRQPPVDRPDPLELNAQSDLPPDRQFINAVFHSSADTVIIPMQDWLGLGNEARMNVPGLPSGNWTWRLPQAALDGPLCQQIREMTTASNRIRHENRDVSEDATA